MAANIEVFARVRPADASQPAVLEVKDNTITYQKSQAKFHKVCLTYAPLAHAVAVRSKLHCELTSANCYCRSPIEKIMLIGLRGGREKRRCV